MAKYYFRNDDVNVNSDLRHTAKIYAKIYENIEDVEIWSCVTLFAEKTTQGTIYKEVPFKNRSRTWFYRANQFVQNLSLLPSSRVVSHGLYHLDHSRLGYEAQEMSILGSCSFLNTHIFVPPFNRFNQHTVDICSAHHIHLVGFNEEWRSLEYYSFVKEHLFWYFHAWRFKDTSFLNTLTQVSPSCHDLSG